MPPKSSTARAAPVLTHERVAAIMLRLACDKPGIKLSVYQTCIAQTMKKDKAQLAMVRDHLMVLAANISPFPIIKEIFKSREGEIQFHNGSRIQYALATPTNILVFAPDVTFFNANTTHYASPMLSPTAQQYNQAVADALNATKPLPSSSSSSSSKPTSSSSSSSSSSATKPAVEGKSFDVDDMLIIEIQDPKSSLETIGTGYAVVMMASEDKSLDWASVNAALGKRLKQEYKNVDELRLIDAFKKVVQKNLDERNAPFEWPSDFPRGLV